MRAVRFAAQLGWVLAPATRRAIHGALPVVAKVAIERISDELGRLVVGRDAARALAIMRETGLLGIVLPAVAALPAPVQAHAARVLGGAPRELTLRFAALLHPLGAVRAEQVLLDLRQPRRVADEVAALLSEHACRLGARGTVFPRGAPELRRLLSRAGPARADALLALAAAEARAMPARARPAAAAEVRALRRALDAIRREAPPLVAQDLAIDGRGVMEALGAGPGPHVGEALRHLLDRVLEDPALNVRPVLEDELRRWWSGRARGA
jgi:tRNA nucleotidyltransferase (CCA-adding enzyme)